MSFRKWLNRIMLVVPFMVLGLLALPSGAAHACLPCYCPGNPTLNCYGDYAVFTQETASGCAIEVYTVKPNQGGTLEYTLTPRMISLLPIAPESDILIATANGISFYVLQNGLYHVTAGPNAENKMYTLTFNGCPASGSRETVYQVGQGANPETVLETGNLYANVRPATPAEAPADPVDTAPAAAPDDPAAIIPQNTGSDELELNTDDSVLFSDDVGSAEGDAVEFADPNDPPSNDLFTQPNDSTGNGLFNGE